MHRKVPVASKHMTARGRELRRKSSFPERLLWGRLRNHRSGPKFRRQQPVGPYVVDFYCALANLAVELDGRSHDDESWAQDQARQAFLERQGLRVIRFSNDRLLRELDAVVSIIFAECDLRTPLSEGEGG